MYKVYEDNRPFGAPTTEYLPSKWHEAQWTSVMGRLRLDELPPLSLAVLVGCVECVSVLRDFGHQARVTDNSHRTTDPLLLSAEFGNVQILEELLKFKDLPLLPESRVHITRALSPLHAAAMNDHTRYMQRLLTAGYPVESVPASLLHLVTTTMKNRPAEDQHDIDGTVQTAEFDDGTGTKHPYPLGDSPLMSAAQKGSFDAVKMLVKNGADINRMNKQDHHTAYTLAVHWGHRRIAKYLKKKHLKAGHPLPEMPDQNLLEVDMVNSDYHEKQFIKKAKKLNVKPAELYAKILQEKIDKGKKINRFENDDFLQQRMAKALENPVVQNIQTDILKDEDFIFETRDVVVDESEKYINHDDL